MRAVFFLTIFLVSGCAGSLEQLQKVREAAPDWYDERKEEIRGETYPRIANVPPLAEAGAAALELKRSRQETLAAFARLLADPRFEAPSETAEQMLAWRTHHAEALMQQIPPVDFMSDTEIQALRARFDGL